MAINYYLLLGVPPDADQKRIKAAYRSMAKRFHPDTNKGSEAAADLFRQINEAYKVLGDDQLRSQYDAKIAVQQTAQQPAQKQAQQPAEPLDPQKKFNRFLNSLLDAILAPDEPVPAPSPKRKGKPVNTRTVRKRPDFNFYYSLAMGKGESSAYAQGKDGIFRRTSDSVKRKSGAKTSSVFSLLLLLFSGICSFLRF